MHVLIAPTSFKGSLSSRGAGEAIERGLRAGAARLGISLTTDVCPIADGGEGTAEILAGALGGAARTSSVAGPLDGTPIGAAWYLVDRVRAEALPARSSGWWHACTPPIAVFDSAQVVGLPLIPEGRRDPARVSTRGIGELIRAAGGEGARAVVIGLGGTASVDGAIGAAAALGWSFLAENGAELDPIGANLGDVARIRPPRGGNAPRTPAIFALTDVTNPLCGSKGAARTFAPQKGASPEQVERLERGLANLARRAHEAGLDASPDTPGAGAAGGLAFGLCAFFGATVLPGAQTVLAALDVDARLARADLVITGEGCLDDQTLHGKAVGALADAARRAGVPLGMIVGQTRGNPRERLALASLMTLVGDGTTASDAQRNAAELLAARAGDLLESLVTG